jgi:hypothetical protein
MKGVYIIQKGMASIIGFRQFDVSLLDKYVLTSYIFR